MAHRPRSFTVFLGEIFVIGGAVLAVASCGPSAPPETDAAFDESTEPAGYDHDGFPFVDRTTEAGLDFVHFNGMSGKLFLAEITCGGGALFDADGDGDLDLYLAQGTMLGPGKGWQEALFPPSSPPPLTDRLYRNELAGTDRGFRLALNDVTAGAGLDGTTGYGCSVAAGDVDNDGDVDLYVGNLGPNQLLANRGDGTFEEVAAAGGAADPLSTVAVAFLDYDRDGWLDLYVANNVDFQLDDPPPCYDRTGAPDYCGPGAHPFQPDHLYRNRGDGTFADVTAAAGLERPGDPALGVVAADFDGDGWVDLYVANDGQPNRLWINRRDGTFRDDGMLAGCALNERGEAEASMGVDAADFDRDGDLDLFLAHLVQETNTLYVNNGRGLFDDRTLEAGLGAASLPYTSFGTAFLDYDLDGWLDLAIVNGAVTHVDSLVERGDPFPLHQPNQLFRNLGGEPGAGVRFAEVAAGPAFTRSEVSRGAAVGDLDNDGDPDLLVINNNGPARLLINRAPPGRPWIGLRLVVPAGPAGDRLRDAYGATAALHVGDAAPRWGRVRPEGSYSVANDPRLLFGLGDLAAEDAERPAEALVTWPDGRLERFAGIARNRYTTLVRGRGEPAAPLPPPDGESEGDGR